MKTMPGGFWITGSDPTRAGRRSPGMLTAVRYLVPTGALVRPGAIRYCRRAGGLNQWERPRAMLRDDPDDAASEAGRWARLIEAVAIRRDREAFATLFRHFAPRVK